MAKLKLKVKFNLNQVDTGSRGMTLTGRVRSTIRMGVCDHDSVLSVFEYHLVVPVISTRDDNHGHEDDRYES